MGKNVKSAQERTEEMISWVKKENFKDPRYNIFAILTVIAYSVAVIADSMEEIVKENKKSEEGEANDSMLG